MLKRQESVMMSSSPAESSRRENVPRHSSVGCMAGILQLLPKYHSRRRFLTGGTSKKHETNKQRNDSSGKRKCRPNVKEFNKNDSIHKTTHLETDSRLMSSEVSVRSPMLPPGIRKSISPENIVSPSLVAAEVDAEVKRRKLVAALEKCDEDLKAISCIINALKSDDQKLPSSPDPLISAFRRFNSSHSLCIDRSSKVASKHIVRNGRMVQQKKPHPRKDFFEKVISRVLSTRTVKTPPWSSKAKLESVEEVCSDLVWGIERELGKIGLVLENHIFRHLVDEFIKELIGDSVYLPLPKTHRIIHKSHDIGGSCTELNFVLPPLPLEACRRRLSF